MTADIIMNTEIGMLKLLQATDSLFPIGAFTMSNGMETYTNLGIVGGGESLSEYLDAYVYLLPYNDLGFAAKAADGENIIQLDSIFAASRSTYELRNGSSKMCTRFLKTEISLGNYGLLKNYSEMILSGQCTGFFPIAVGLFIRDIGADIYMGLEMYGYSLLSAAVNHAVKLVPLRQLTGQECLSKAAEKIPETAARALKVQINDLGISGAGFDLRSMQHEKLYSRIYIS